MENHFGLVCSVGIRYITDCAIGLDLLCPLDRDFPMGIHLPYHMDDRL